jgi:hypothetical protein
MASRAMNLLPSEYNGIRFYWESEDEKGGRNLAIYKHPNSNKQTIQDMGGIPQTFTVNAIIAGSNYLADSERFRNALIVGGVGDLIIPNFGIHKVRLESYSRSTSQKQIGRHDYTLTFLLEEMTGLAGEDYVSIEDIYNGYLEANQALADSLARNWESPTTNANRLSAISDTQQFLDAMQDVAKAVNGAVRKVEKLKNQVETAVSVGEIYADLLVTEGPLAMIASAVGIGSSYSKIVSMIDFGKNFPNRLAELATTVIDAFSTQINDGYNFFMPLWDEDYTAEWNQRNNNRKMSIETMRAGAMMALLNDIPNIDFQTSEDIRKYQIELQGFFQSLTNVEDSIIFEDSGFMEKLLALKEYTFGYMNQIQDDVFYLVDINISQQPANVLSAKLYGEESRDEIIARADILKSLNDGKVIFDGDTTVLEKNND